MYIWINIYSIIKYLLDISFNHVIYIYINRKNLHLKNIHYVLRNAVL